MNEEEFNKLRRRVEDLELNNDSGILNLMITGLPKESKATFFRCIEQGVANYFGIDRSHFFDTLVGAHNRAGRKGRNIPSNPSDISDPIDKIIIARFILYGILHIDFSVPIVELAEWYSLRVKNYIREWKNRYIRIFHTEDVQFAANDDAYRMYWVGCHAEIIRECERNGLYDELIDRLKRFDSENNFDDIYLVKWRIDTE